MWFLLFLFMWGCARRWRERLPPEGMASKGGCCETVLPRRRPRSVAVALQAGILDMKPPYTSWRRVVGAETRVSGLAWQGALAHSVECPRRHCIPAPEDCLQNDRSIIVLQG